MKTISLMLALAVSSIASPSFAQIPGGRELVNKVAIKGVASKARYVDYYYFAGQGGSHQAFTLSGKGRLMLVLLDAEGKEVAHAESKGAVAKMDSTLASTAVYTLAVFRQDPAAVYSLTRTADAN